MTSANDDLTYPSYLRLDDLLSCQRPRTDSRDELLFVIMHQVYELWKQVEPSPFLTSMRHSRLPANHDKMVPDMPRS